MPNVVATDGTVLPLDNLAQTLTYSNGLVATITVTNIQGGNTPGTTTYRQTLTQAGGVITNVGQWVPVT
jgi:hypothetical protein